VTADELAAVAGLLADRTRAAVCTTLLDGQMWTAGDLARSAGVSASTMSEHLTRLIDGGLLTEHRQGRHRYVALIGAHVAATLEQLLTLTEPAPPARSLREVSTREALRWGRTCYDHLAGRLGVAMTEAMIARRLLDDELALTPKGERWLADLLGSEVAPTRRPRTRACLDWTERRHHLAGAAGAHLCSELFARGWIRRTGTGRPVRTTTTGDEALQQLLGFDPARLTTDGQRS
jgi:DNA-binding transcriptional ArsR family regulator